MAIPQGGGINQTHSLHVQREIVKVDSQELTSGAAMTGTKSKEAKDKGGIKEHSHLSEKARMALLEAELADGADTAKEQTSVADDTAQSMRLKRKDENRTTEDLGDGQVHADPEGIVQQSGTSGDASGADGGDDYALTKVEEQNLARLDTEGHAVQLNADLDPNKVAAAERVVETRLDENPESLTDNLESGPPEFEGQVAGMRLEPAEKLEVAGKPLVDDLPDVEHTQPMQLDDPHAEEMARTAAAEKLASGDLNAGGEFNIAGAKEVGQAAEPPEVQLARAHVDASIQHFGEMDKAYSDPVIWKEDGTGLMTNQDWNGLMDQTRTRLDGMSRNIVQGQLDRGEIEAGKLGVELKDGKLPEDFGAPAAFKSGAMSAEQLDGVRKWAQAEATNEWAHNRFAQEDVQGNPEAMRSLENLAFHATMVNAHNDAANALLSGKPEQIKTTRENLQATESYHKQIQAALNPKAEIGQADATKQAEGHVTASLQHFGAMNQAYQDPVIWNEKGTGLMTNEDWAGMTARTQVRTDEKVRSMLEGQIKGGALDPSTLGVELKDGRLPADFTGPDALKKGAVTEEQLRAVWGWSQAEVTTEWAHERFAKPDVQNNPQAMRSLENLAYHSTMVNAHNDAANAVLSGNQQLIGDTRKHIDSTNSYHQQIQQVLGGGRAEQQEDPFQGFQPQPSQTVDLSDYGDVELPGVTASKEGAKKDASVYSPGRS